MIRRPTDFEERWPATTLRRSGEHGDYDYHQFMLDVVDVLRA